jgi:3-oxoacyl-[acyl-carrier protein] reductase
MNFEKRVAIVTGGASGMGKATAILLAENKANVVVADVNTEGVKKFSEEIIPKYQQECMAEVVDISKKEEVNSFVTKVVKKFQKVDILVNCAGIDSSGDFLELSEDTWNRVIDINLKGTFLIGQRVMKEMAKKRYGRIINIASISGEIGGKLSGADYAASKGGVFAFTKTIARYGAQYNITANCISPGQIDTQMTGNWNEEQKKAFTDNIPMKRFGEPEEVAYAILFLASEESSFITGATLHLNGGELMS